MFGTLGDPARLVATLGTALPTLCHGDAWLVNVALTDDEVVLLDWALATCGPLVDDAVWDATVLWALCELGWNKALDATTHADPVQRAAAAAELEWWVAQADAALSRNSAATA